MIFKLQDEGGDKKRKPQGLGHQTIFAKAYLKSNDASASLASSDAIYKQALARIVHRHRPVDWNAYQPEDSASIECYDEVPFPSKLQNMKSYAGHSKGGGKQLGALAGDGKQLINNKRGCTLMTNCTSVSEPMLRMLTVAEGKLRHKAYL